jgi:hypothetical protein
MVSLDTNERQNVGVLQTKIHGAVTKRGRKMLFVLGVTMMTISQEHHVDCTHHSIS